MKRFNFIASGILLLFLAGVCRVEAASRTWVPTTGTNDWFDPAYWDGSTTLPTNGDDVIIANAGAALLTNSPGVYLGSLTLSKTLIFSNWNTTLSATNVTIPSGGVITLPGAFTTNDMSNNIVIACRDIFIDAGGTINANGKGYAGGTVSHQYGYGPGAGTGAGNAWGGGYGGLGGDGTTNANGGCTYGSAGAPVEPGSGGGYSTSGEDVGHAGGGAIRISAANNMTVNGSILANGGNSAPRGGAGSGGSIYLSCRTFYGTNGVISATGGNQGYLIPTAGGGGRVAVIYDPAAQAAAPSHSVQFNTRSGIGSADLVDLGTTYYIGSADIGTLYFPDQRLLGETLIHSGQLIIPGLTNWAPNNLMISNGWMRIPVEGFRLSVTNDLVINGNNAVLQLGGRHYQQIGFRLCYFNTDSGPTLTCGRNLVVTNGGRLFVYSGPTNASNPDNGALVSVVGDIVVATVNSWIVPAAHPTNGASVLFQMKNLLIPVTNAGVNASQRGYAGGTAADTFGYGPGGGLSGGNAWGGGYGGLGGGGGGSYGGKTYGSSNTPVEVGSGGGYSSEEGGRPGGGNVRMQVDRTITLYGSIIANGANNSARAGAGSGGGIYLTCHKFIGDTNGVLRADGGNQGYFGYNGGGGGRIAVWRAMDHSIGAVQTSVTNGTGLGTPGTVVWGLLPMSGTIITLR